MPVATQNEPNALMLVPEDGTEVTVFENAIRCYGVQNACEWFGVADRARLVCIVSAYLSRRSEEAKK